MSQHKNPKANPSQPAFVAGNVTFEFWGNDDESHRNRVLRNLAKNAHAKMNVSVIPILDGSDLERGELVFAGASENLEKARSMAKSVMDFLEAESSARIVHDNWIAEELP